MDGGRDTYLGVPPPPFLTWPGVPTLDGGEGWGVDLPWMGGGIPTLGYPHADLARGEGVPTLDGGGGYLPWMGGGVPTLGYPLPPGCEKTDTCENSTFPSYNVRGR